MWKNIVVDTSLYPIVKTVTYNAWFWVHAIYSYVLLIAGTINLFGLFFRTSSIFRKQTGILLLASFAPWVANLLFITGIGPSFSIDPTPMAFVVTGVSIFWGLSRTQLLHMMPIAYEAIFRSMTGGVIIIDKQNFIVETNSAAQRIFKLNKSEIIGKTLNQIIPGHEYLLELKTDMTVTELTISLEQDQMERFYNLSMSPIIIGQRFSGLIVLLHDDTERRKAENESREKAVLETELNERKQMEKAIRDSEEKFSKAFNASPDAISISKLSDGAFLEVNDSYTYIFGYSREELVGQNADKFNLWADSNQRETMLQKIQENVKIHNEEMEFRAKSGEINTLLISTEYLSIGGEPCVLVVSTDITDRKKMEEALYNEAKRRLILVEQSSDGIVILNQDGAVHEANRRFAEMLGYSPEEILKLHVWDWEYLYPPEQVREMIRTVDEAGDHITTRHRRKDGTIYDVEISTNGVVFSGQKLIFCVCRDISERKRMEKALKESEEKFSLAFWASPAIVAITTSDSGRYIEVNDSYLNATGYSREELIGKTSQEAKVWANLEERARLLKTIEEQGKVRNEEFSFRMKSGDIRTWLFSAEKIDIAGERCLIGVSVDITDRKKTEEALREREKRFSDISESAMEWIWEVDARGKYTYSSPVVEKILGYTTEEVLKKHFYDFFIPEEREGLKKAALEAFAQKLPIREFINKNRRKDGLTVELLTSGVPVIDEGGNLLGYRGVDTDVTERRRAEQALREAMTNLQQSSSQLAATNKELEAFSYSVSHDLRSPLRSIDGFSQALLEDYQGKLDKTGQDYLTRLRNASQKMGELIDGILKLSRLTRSELHYEPTNLSALAEEIASRLQEMQPERRVKFVIDKDLTANGDPQMLRVLLENLLSNAWKFTSKKRQSKIEFSMEQNNGKKAYFIKDDGAGFDMAYSERLFKAFQRLHEVTEFSGTGIGLATVQSGPRGRWGKAPPSISHSTEGA
jgi:PAS domain S-box-containing protein